MRKVLTVLLCLFVIACAGGFALWELWLKGQVSKVMAVVSEEQNNGGGSTHVPVPDDPNFGTWHDPITDDIEAFRADVVQRLGLRDFDGLEAIAEEARTKRARFGTGSWKIAQYYSALELSSKASEDAWQGRLATYREWQQKQPESITPRVALADALTSYAWKARGTDYADKVTDDGWKRFEQRLAEAFTVLKDARNLSVKDPYWWLAAQTVALGQGWERDEYEKLFTEAVAFEPEFWGYYTKKAHFLLPRWHGEPGEWEKFAEESIKVPGGLGAELYTRIVLNLNDYHKSNIFHESKARWDLTKAGFEKMRERYPDSTALISDFAMLATQGNDAKSSKEMFDLLGDRIDRRTWKSKDRYQYYYRYSHPGGN